MKSGRWFLALSLLAVGLTPPGQGVVERIQGFYEGTRALKGQFSQRVELAMGQVEEARGAFYLKRPGMMRWEYEQPERRLLVTNGNTLWAYTPTDRQVIVQDLKTAVSSIPFDFLVGAGRLTDQFVLRQVNLQGDSYRLVLIPRRADPHLSQMEMEVDEATLYIRSLTIQDPYENRTVMRFSHVEVTKDLPADLFSFVPPPGVKVLRAEELFPR
ncbi:MAG: Outer-membrane lipoprotein carrier protein [candidate division NC10 bacterium CSP1-5]|nr:MAG: Outer-membrane lipoprotein carrier protein [candidate division NC10 bacterium CSP1-5]